MIKYSLYFFLIFFCSYSFTYAIPFVAAVPFIFELWVLLYSFIALCCTTLVIWFYKNIKTTFFFFSFLLSISYIFLIFLISWEQFRLIHISFISGDILYLYILTIFLLFFFFLGLISWYKQITFYAYFIIILSLLFLSVIQISLFYDIYILNSNYEKLIDKIYEEDYVIEDFSRKQLNSIFVSQDFQLSKEETSLHCRVTLSPYLHTEWPYQAYANKTQSLRLYLWLDGKKCREIISPIFRSL